MGRRGWKLRKSRKTAMWGRKSGTRDWKLRRKPQDWQEGLKDGQERLEVEEKAPRLEGEAGRRAA
jgi:hypothetical protein